MSGTMVCAGDKVVNKTRCPLPNRAESPPGETNIKHLIKQSLNLNCDKWYERKL